MFRKDFQNVHGCFDHQQSQFFERDEKVKHCAMLNAAWDIY